MTSNVVNEALVQKRVFIVSRCPWMVGLHRYLLENVPEISLYSVKRPSTLSSQQLTHRDVVVLHADRESDQIADLLGSIPHSNSGEVPAWILITKQQNFRDTDRMSAFNRGCAHVFSSDFKVSEYVLALYSVLAVRANTPRSPVPAVVTRSVCVSKNDFVERMNRCLEQRVMFAIIFCEVKSGAVSTLAAIIRHDDLLYIETHHRMFILCRDSGKHNVEKLLARIARQEVVVETSTIVDAVDIFNFRNELDGSENSGDAPLI